MTQNAAAQSGEQPLFPVAFLNIAKDNASLNQFIDVLSKQSQFEIVLASSAKEVIEVVEKAGFGIVFFQIKGKPQLIEVVNVLMRFEKQLKLNVIKVLGALDMNDQKVSSFLSKKGVSEMMQFPIPQRALTHKFNRWLTLVEKSKTMAEKKGVALAGATFEGSTSKEADTNSVQTFKRDDAPNSGGSRGGKSVDESPMPSIARPNFGGKNSSQDKEGSELEELRKEPADASAKIEWLGPTISNSDCWIVFEPREVRRVRGKWFIDVMGPPPHLGRWVECNIDESFGQECWKYESRGTENPFLKDSGNWITFGKKPEYSWREQKWQFIASVPHLAFYDGKDQKNFRWMLRDEALLITKNQTNAQDTINKIMSLRVDEKTFKQLEAREKSGKDDDDYSPMPEIARPNLGGKRRNPFDSTDSSGDSAGEISDPETAALNALRSEPADTGDGAGIEWLAPVVLKSDCWVIGNFKEVRRVKKKWFIDLMGPPPNLGRWVECKVSSSNGQKAWKYESRVDTHPFIHDEGSWITFGKKPEFSWREHLWQFVADRPHLGFYKGETLVVARWSYSETSLKISKNQGNAQEMVNQFASFQMDEKKFKELERRESQEGGNPFPKFVDLNKSYGNEPQFHNENDAEDDRPRGKKKQGYSMDSDWDPNAEGFRDPGVTQRSSSGAPMHFELPTDPEQVDWGEKLADTGLRIEMFSISEKSGEALSPVLETKILDFFDNELTLTSDRSIFNPGDLVAIKLQVKKPVFASVMKGQVISTEEIEDGQFGVEITLTTYRQEDLKKIEEIFGERQGNITDFMKQAKGI